MPSPRSTASWSPSPCFTSLSSDCAIAADLQWIRSPQPNICSLRPYSLRGHDDSRLGDDLVASACERAGLDDFGDDSWRDGLRLLVETVESAPGVNPGGRDYVYGQFVDALWNRLRVVDYIKHHPEVARGTRRTSAGGPGTAAYRHIAGELSARPRSAAAVAVDLGGRGFGATLDAGHAAHRPALPEEEGRTRRARRGAQSGQHPDGALGRGRRTDGMPVRPEPGLQGIPVGGLHADRGVRRLAARDRHDERLRL